MAHNDGELLEGVEGGDVIMLGAGFSKAVNDRFPLADDLGDEVLARTDLEHHWQRSAGWFEAWMSQLAEPQPYLTHGENTENLAALERLLQELHTVVSRREREALEDGLPSWLVRFVGALHARQATVITFNYDRLVERTVHELRPHDFDDTPDSHLLEWWETLQDVPSFPPLPSRWSGEPMPTLHLLKLHGSLNWFWVPGDASGLTLHHWELDDDDEDKRRRHLPGREPFIVPPTATKSSYLRNAVMGEIWRRAAEALRKAAHVALVGYSLPITDLLVTGLLADTLNAEADLFIANPEPDAVVKSIQRLTDIAATTLADAKEYGDGYVERASRELADRIRSHGSAFPKDTLILVGWNHETLARVVDVEKSNACVTLKVAEFDDRTPHGPAGGPNRPDARPVSDLVERLSDGDRIDAQFADGTRSPVVGIDGWNVEAGASTHFQILTPADRPSDLEIRNWRQRLELDHA